MVPYPIKFGVITLPALNMAKKISSTGIAENGSAAK